MEKETVLSLYDIRHVSITCPHCGAQVILDMTAYKANFEADIVSRRPFTPDGCPDCKLHYDSLGRSLDHFQEAYALLSVTKGVVAFHVDDEDIAHHAQQSGEGKKNG